MTDRVRKTLAANPMFAGCRPESIEGLLHAGVIRAFPAGATVYLRGDDLTSLLLVLSGSLELSIASPEGKRFVRWFLDAGQLRGIIPAIDGKPAIFDTICHTDAVLFLMPREAFVSLLPRDPVLTRSVLLMLCDRSRRQYDFAASDALFNAQAKAAHMLLQLAETYGKPTPDGLRITLKLPQEKFAALLGIARQQANRILKALETDGTLSLAYSEITIRNLERLRATADGAH